MNSADTHKQIPTIIESGSDTFEVLSVLGKGGMGIVYKACQKNLNRIVAIKMLQVAHSTDPTTLHRLKIEAKAAAQVNHPNIVKVYSFGTLKNEQPFISMEYVEGRTLADLLCERKTLTATEVYNLFEQALQALHCLHSAGFLHRDIKPSNLMVTADGIVKLMDFGIAKEMNSLAEQSLTRTSAMLGSPQYMSPEQCEGKPLDARTDIYALGCSIYEALAGHPPFAGENPLDVMFKKLHQQADTLAGTVDPRLSELVAKALAKEREDRFQSATEFLDALNACKSGDYVSGRRKTKVRAWLTGSPKKRLLLAAIAATMLVSVVLVTHQPQQPTPYAEKRQERLSPRESVEQALRDRYEIDATLYSSNRKQSREAYLQNKHDLENALIIAREERDRDSEVRAARELAVTVSRFDPGRAENLHLSALELADKVYGAYPDDIMVIITPYQVCMGFFRQNVNVKQFRAVHERALAIANARFARDKANPSSALLALAELKAEENQMAMRLGQYPQSEKFAREAIELCRRAQAGAPLSWQLPHKWVLLAETLQAQSKWDELAKEMEQAVEVTQVDSYGMDTRRRLLFKQCLAASEAYGNLQNKPKCIDFFNKAMPITEELDEHNALLIDKGTACLAMFNHAVSLTKLGDPKAALDWAVKTADKARDTNGKLNSASDLTFLMYATRLSQALNDQSALPLATESGQLAKRLGDPREAEATILTGAVHYLGGNYQEAEETLATGREQLAKAHSQNKAVDFIAARYSALTAWKLNKREEAVKWCKSAKAILDGEKTVLHQSNVFITEYKEITGNAP